MSLRNLVLFFVCSFLALVLMWIFNVTVVRDCYLVGRDSLIVLDFPIDLSTRTLPHCLAVVGSMSAILLIGLPLLITLISMILYRIFMGTTLSYAGYILWISWAAVIYYASTSLSFFRPAV